MFRGEQDNLTQTNPGDIIWVTSSDNRSNVNYYMAQARAEGSSTVVSTLFLGKPVSANSARARVNGASWLNSLTSGNYTVDVLAVNASGSTDSANSAAFTVPLAAE